VIFQNQLHPAEQLHDHINLIIASPTSTTPLVHAIGRIGTKVLVPPSPVDSNLRAHTWGLQFRLYYSWPYYKQINWIKHFFSINESGTAPSRYTWVLSLMGKKPMVLRTKWALN